MDAFSSILPARNYDHSAIMALFEECTRAMLAAGIGQWHFDYPARAQVKKDIERGEVFVWQEDLVVLGTITLNAEQSAQYQQIQWQYQEEPALVIHRLAVHPQAQGRKIGWHLCRFAEHYAQKHQYPVIRLDAYSGNPYSDRLYRRLEYQLAEGYCWFHDNELPFNCWEKKIQRS